MKNFIYLFSIFISNSKLLLSRSMAYRFNFFVGIFITLIFALIGPLMQFLIFTQTKGYPGWDMQQILLFQGVLLVVIGLKNTLFGSFKSQFIGLVKTGNLDRFLLKPFTPIETLLVTSFNADSIITVITGIIITAYMIINIGISITLLKISLFTICIIAALVMSIALDIIHNSIIVLTIADGGIQGIINAYLRFAEYPLEIYPRILQALFTVFFPLAIITYFPTQVLLNRIDLRIIYSFIGVLLFLFFSLKIWKNVLKKYTSAGG